MSLYDRARKLVDEFEARYINMNHPHSSLRNDNTRESYEACKKSLKQIVESETFNPYSDDQVMDLIKAMSNFLINIKKFIHEVNFLQSVRTGNPNPILGSFEFSVVDCIEDLEMSFFLISQGKMNGYDFIQYNTQSGLHQSIQEIISIRCISVETTPVLTDWVKMDL
jgi:hypothetical protein